MTAADPSGKNNFYSEQTKKIFPPLPNPLVSPRKPARHILNETERRNIRQHGYGVRSFGRSLEENYMKLARHPAERTTVEAIHYRGGEMERTPPSIPHGGVQTPAYLAQPPPPHLFTKGEPAGPTA